MELRDAYAVPSESEPLRRFLNGEPPPEYDKSDWTGLIREATSRGVVVSRVRGVTVPHSGYQRWLLSVTGENVAAGEDIRYLPRHLVQADDLPADDWWLFDDQQVAFNLVDTDGRTASRHGRHHRSGDRRVLPEREGATIATGDTVPPIRQRNPVNNQQ